MSEKGNEIVNNKTEAVNKLNCDIVRDLVPSYLENICSKSSEEAVEAHLAECADCCRHVQNLRQTAIEGTQANLKEIDHMKKIHRYYDKKVLVHLIGISLAVFTVFWCVNGSRWDMKSSVYEIAFPVITILLLVLLKDGNEYREKRVLRRILAGLALFGCVAIAGLTGILFGILKTQKAPFGLEMVKIGPVLSHQIAAVVILEAVVLVWSLWDSMQKDCRLGFTSVAALAVMAYGMVFNDFLYRMDDFVSMTALIWQTIVVFGVEAVVLCGVTAVLSRSVQDGFSQAQQ